MALSVTGGTRENSTVSAGCRMVSLGMSLYCFPVSLSRLSLNRSSCWLGRCMAGTGLRVPWGPQGSSHTHGPSLAVRFSTHGLGPSQHTRRPARLLPSHRHTRPRAQESTSRASLYLQYKNVFFSTVHGGKSLKQTKCPPVGER